MFNSKFLKGSSYAVLSASVISMAQNANGFAQIESGNEKKTSFDSKGKNVLLPFKQQSPDLDSVSSVNEMKNELESIIDGAKAVGRDVKKYNLEQNKKQGRGRKVLLGFLVVGVIILIYLFAEVVFYYRRFFLCGTEKFQALSFWEKIFLAHALGRDNKIFEKAVLSGNFKIAREKRSSIESMFREYFDLREACPLLELNLNTTSSILD